MLHYKLLKGLSIFVLLFPVLLRAEEENLVPNPGCETNTGNKNTADNWIMGTDIKFPAHWDMKQSKGIVKLDSIVVHGGKYSQSYTSPKRIEKDLSEADAWNWNKWHQIHNSSVYWTVPFSSPEFNVKKGDKYRLSAWVKAENMISLHIKVIWINTDGKPVWKGDVLVFPREQKMSTYDWEEWSVVVSPPTGMVKCRLDYVLNEGESDGKIWTDDISVKLVK